MDISSDYDIYDDGSQPDSALQGKKRGCVAAIILVFILMVVGVGFLLLNGRQQAAKPVPTPTLYVDDGKPAEVESGLEMVLFSSGGVVADETVQISLDLAQGVINPSALNVLSYPEGAFFDTESRQLVVFGPPALAGSHPTSDDFLVALQAVYGQQPLAISIDPISGQDDIQAVRYEGPTADTHFGWVMFESDRVMKTLSMGEDNETRQPVLVSVPGYASLLDLIAQNSASQQDQNHRRFWFTAPVVEIEQTPDGYGMWITNLELVVRTEYLDENWQPLPSQLSDPAGQIFADHLSENLDAYALDFQVFSELQAIAHWTALAHWLHQADLPIDPSLWLVQSVELYESPKTTPAITVSRNIPHSNGTRTLKVWGGVDLSMQPSIQPASNVVKSKLRDFTNALKGWSGIGKVEVAQDDIVFGFVSTLGPQAQLARSINLETSPALSLVYTDNHWLLNLPRLKRYGYAENSYFLFQAPTADAPIVLTFAGFDSRNNAPVFINRHAGLRLQEFSDDFVLAKGEFLSDGQFSYVENQQAVFDSDGRILSDALDSSFHVSYEYKNGQLTNIHHLSDDSHIKLEYRSGKLHKIQSATGGPIQFEYKNGGLITIKKAGNEFQSFEYNSQGLLAKEFGPNNLLIRETRYDSLGRILFQWQNNTGTLYDWQQNGQVRLASGASLNFWRHASESDLQELNIALRLAEHPSVEHLVFARQVGEDVVILADNRSFRLPAYLLQYPENFRKKLSGLLDVRPGARVLISTGNLGGISFQSLFPAAMPITVETLDEKRVWENLDFLMQPIMLNEQNSALLNGIPLSTELDKVNLLASSASNWVVNGREFREIIDNTILENRFSSQPLLGKRTIVEALSSKQAVILVIAHGDQQKIYQPDGNKFNLNDLTDEDKATIAAQKPLVILLSCNTGSQIDGESSFSQKLIEIGPRMVVAPNGLVSVEDATTILDLFLQNARNENSIDAILDALREVYPDWLIKKDNPDGQDYFFQFRTENNPTRKDAGT